MTDAELLAVLEEVYEYIAWACGMGRLDFDVLDALAAVIGELRFRAEIAA